MRRTTPAAARRRAAMLGLALLAAPHMARAEDDRLVAVLWGERHLSHVKPSDLVEIARSYDGKRASQLGLPRSLWCADFVNKVRREAGLKAVPSRLARDQTKVGRRLSAPRVGAVVVLSRGRSRTAGHTGIVTGITPAGDVVVISGNHGHRVAESVYPRSRVIAYVDPSS